MIDVETGRHTPAQAGADRLAVPLFVALSVTYAAFACALAQRKLMWNDEPSTYYIARLPSMHDVIGALAAGGEQTPPFFYAITRLSLKLFGVNNISIRLPEIIAFWVVSVCLYAIVARRMSPMAAVCAAVFPLVTSAFMYSYEARPYGLVLGFTALAFLLWQTATSATTRRGRVFAVIGLAFSLAAAISTHYYGVFVLGPFVFGEAMRTASRRRVDAPVWAAFVMSIVPLAWHVPLIKAATGYSRNFWSPPQWVNAPDFYQELLFPALLPIAALLILSAVQPRLMFAPQDPDMDADERAMQSHELAAAAGFVLLPVVCVVIAKLVTGAFVNRYALPAVIGFGVLAGVGSEVAFRRHPSMRVAVVVCLVGWFALSQAREWIAPTGYSQPFPPAAVLRPAEWVDALEERSLPLVIADAHTFTMLSHYGAPAIKSRIVYLADPDRALARLGHNSVERGMLDLLKPWFHMNVVPFEPFLAQHRRFLVYADFVKLAFINWLEPELRARGMHIELLNRGGDNMLLLASRDSR